MALNYALTSAEPGIIVITGDYANAAEWRELLTRMAQDPRCHGGRAFLRDLRNGTHPVDAATVAAIIEVVREFWGAVKPYRGAVVTRDGENVPTQIAYALADEHHIPIRAFNSYLDAVEWLREGLKPSARR